MEAMPASELSLWTIYAHPADYPEGFVIRRFYVGPGGRVRKGEAYVAPSLEAVRKLVPTGLACLDRSVSDEPQIVETWI